MNICEHCVPVWSARPALGPEPGHHIPPGLVVEQLQRQRQGEAVMAVTSGGRGHIQLNVEDVIKHRPATIYAYLYSSV